MTAIDLATAQQPPGTILCRTTSTPSAALPVADRFASVVLNTGNLFYETALLRHLPRIAVVYGCENLPDNVERLVLSMSNFISPASELGWVAEVLERKRVRQIVMVGAGAQAYTYDEPIALSAGTRRFVDLLADRSISIGVRGNYTAEVLRGLGVSNVSVIGCPSAFWHGAERPITHNRTLPWWPRTAINVTPSGHFRDRISALLGHGMRYGANYVLQSEDWMMALVEPTAEAGLLDENLDYYAYPHCTPEMLRRWLADHLIAFFDIGEWIDAMRHYDFVYGSRFHGNMAAIQAGVPALNMVFDTRTRELCEYLNLPFMALQDFSGDMRVAELWERADFSLFNATYKRKFATYIGFLEENGLCPDTVLPVADKGACALAPSAIRISAMNVAELLRDALAVGLQDASLLDHIAARLRADRPPAVREAVERADFTGS